MEEKKGTKPTVNTATTKTNAADIGKERPKPPPIMVDPEIQGTITENEK